jgi:hypothetical protein
MMTRQQLRFSRRLRLVGAVLFLIGLLGVPSALAAKFAGAFMENGGGARALGMGGAFVAVANDASTTFWNPAGLGGLEHRSIMFMHSERFGGLVNRDFLAFATPTDWSLLGGQRSGFGVSIIRLGVDDIPFTEHLLPMLDGWDGSVPDGVISDEELLGLLDPEIRDQIRFVSDQEYGFFLSYGEQKGEWFIGGNLKFIRQSVGDYSSLGIGADLGAMRPDIWRSLSFGLKLQDITTTYLSWSTGTNEVIYPAVVPGFAYRWNLADMRMEILLASSFEMRFENRGGADQWSSGRFSCNSHWGLEAGFSRRVFLRTGFDSGFGAADLTAGVGLYLHPLIVDYAYAGDTLDIDEVTHRISLTVRF